MNQKIKLLWLIILIGVFFSSPLYAEKKLAQTGFQFLSVLPDARSASLAGAMTTMPTGSAALWSNPATLTEMNGRFDFVASQNKWIAEINHYAVTAAYRPLDGRLGNFAVSFLYVDYGEIESTIIAGNEQGYYDMGIIEPFSYQIGFGYARRLTDRFSVGGQIKYVDQYLGPVLTTVNATVSENTTDNEVSVFAFDFGTRYKTGFKSLVFGMSVRNFSKEVRYAKEGFQLPLTFNIGASMNLFDFMSQWSSSHSFVLSMDAAHPRSYPEFAKFGVEYGFQQTFYLRVGYVSNRDEEDVTYGFGFQKFGLGLDYAYTPFGVFENVQRFSINFSF